MHACCGKRDTYSTVLKGWDTDGSASALGSRPHVVFCETQERDLQAAAYRTLLSAEEDEDSAHLVYLGLAAAAFLLLTLYPSGGVDHVSGSPKTMTPLSSEGPLHSGAPAVRWWR